jgi:hypothetical protein
MANFTRIDTIINASFKSLSVVNIAIASARLATQYAKHNRRILYVTLTFWLIIEAAVALIMASISSYRHLILNYVAQQRQHRGVTFESPKSHAFWVRARSREESPSSASRTRLADYELHPISRYLPKLNVDAMWGPQKPER